MRSFFLRALSRIVIVVSASLLAGCAALPTTAPDAAALSRHALDDFMIEGRFSVRQDEQNHSGRLRWKHAGGSDEVLLASPFGQGVAEIVADARSATLTTSDGKTYSAADSESLTEQVLGYRLPLSLLADWVRGRLVPERIAERDALGRPVAMRHEDWRVAYEYDSDAPDALPGRLFAERIGVFELRLRIDEWTRLP